MDDEAKTSNIQEVEKTLNVEEAILEIKKDTDAILSAVKELTTQIAGMAKEWEKWRKAGKF